MQQLLCLMKCHRVTESGAQDRRPAQSRFVRVVVPGLNRLRFEAMLEFTHRGIIYAQQKDIAVVNALVVRGAVRVARAGAPAFLRKGRHCPLSGSWDSTERHDLMIRSSSSGWPPGGRCVFFGQPSIHWRCRYADTRVDYQRP